MGGENVVEGCVAVSLRRCDLRCVVVLGLHIWKVTGLVVNTDGPGPNNVRLLPGVGLAGGLIGIPGPDVDKEWVESIMDMSPRVPVSRHVAVYILALCATVGVRTLSEMFERSS